ncbi:hypothetical protein BDN70DRAFT_886445 [Pholiota conissans]|uniref:Eisosome component PIL1-domain-containing protein n=1 Tax=Pholiota conissans TaxID=109636 RepID=A0A9P5YSJ8_9AGAR|nr:hypothetical protein BDN70DRAFT_886445 [Pholiota conissans]
MFKTAATKIAHNSTLPALGGNQELRHLQDLITAEKSVLIALQKLSVDYSKASEALRTWGLNEGDDLGDILSASTTILNHFSSALSQYASHGHVIRDQLKAIRTREEALEDLKRRRRTVVRKAEDADKKLSKMSPEHKNLAMQTDILNRLRDEIRSMDSEIMTEEAALGDFKRSSTRMWMGLKFGGLLEMCEKGTIVAEFGKMLIGEISEEITQPGLPRSMYYGHSKTENYVAEAHRCINEVVLSTVPSVGFRDRHQYENRAQEASGYQPGGDSAYGMNADPWTPTDTKPMPPPPLRSSNDYPAQRPYGGDDGPSSPLATTGSSFQNQPNQYQQPYGSPPMQQQQQPLSTMDDFGVSNRSAGLVDNSNTSGGRFATFPVKRPNGGYSLQDPPLLGPRPDQESSFSDSIAAALDGHTEETSHATEGPHSQGGSWIAGRFIPGPPSSYGTEETTRAVEGPPSFIGQQSRDTPQSSYKSSASPPPQIRLPSPQRQFTSQSSPLPPPPPGAALPDLSDPWANANRDGSLQAASHTRGISEISGNDDLLAYMTTPQSEPPSPMTPTHAMHSNELAAADEEEQQRISRHVRFGDVKDVEGEMKKREATEKEKGTAQESRVVEPASSPPEYTQSPVDNATPSSTIAETSREAQDNLSLSPTTSHGSDITKSKPHRIPPPTFNSEEDEKALNAAAAREISLELEALKNSPPKPAEMTQQSQTEPVGDRGRPSLSNRGYSDQPSDNSSLPPPAAPFAKRNVSPHPYAELNDNSAPQPQYPGQYTSAQLYAQSYQNSAPYVAAVPSSPAQAYAQTYQNTHASDPHPPSNIPPRFQALNQEIQVPPRFQGARSHSPGSPTASQLPPRFQAGASQIPPTITLPENESRFGQTKGSETPYRTPPEYPRGLSINSSYTRSTSSLTSGSPVTSSAPRTISAAAFKRPRNTSVDNLGGQSDPFTKKTLPSSPYPLRDNASAAATPERSNTIGVASAAAASTNTLPPGAGPPGTGARKSILDDDEYDYISAYVNNSNPNSPQKPEFGHNAQDANAASRGAGGGGGGYNDGRFATDLDNNSLR